MKGLVLFELVVFLAWALLEISWVHHFSICFDLPLHVISCLYGGVSESFKLHLFITCRALYKLFILLSHVVSYSLARVGLAGVLVLPLWSGFASGGTFATFAVTGSVFVFSIAGMIALLFVPCWVSALISTAP